MATAAPARPRRGPTLRETPWDRAQSPATTTALLQLSFRCATCDTLIVPEGVVSRITVRASPETQPPPAPDTTEAYRKRVPTEAVYADSLPSPARVRRVAETNELLAAQLLATNRYAKVKPAPHDLLCDGCGRRVGYVLEHKDVPGLPLERPNEDGRAYKLYYWTPTLGNVLVFDEAALAKWVAMEANIPAPLPAARERRGQLELAHELAARLGVRVADVPAVIQSDRTPYFRSLRIDEPHREGLAARFPEATNTPFEHVMKGSATSRFVSVSSSPNIACLWALPFGPIVTINKSVATLLGDEYITIAELERNVATTEHIDNAIAVLRVQSAQEALFVGGVHKLAVERLVSRIDVVCTVPNDVGAKGDGSDAFPSNTTIPTLRLEEFPAELVPSPDMGASFVVDPSTGARYVLFRVSRNSLPPHKEGDTDAAFPNVLMAARDQLARACRIFRCEDDGAATLAYYEADVVVFQFERSITSFDNIRIERLPFLLLRCDGPTEAIKARMKRIYELKKGVNELASSTRRVATAVRSQT